MLYNVLSYDPSNRTAVGLHAAIGHDYKGDGNYPPHSVLLYSYAHLTPGKTYSFAPKNEFINGDFIRGELDYKNGGALEDSIGS